LHLLIIVYRKAPSNPVATYGESCSSHSFWHEYINVVFPCFFFLQIICSVVLIACHERETILTRRMGGAFGQLLLKLQNFMSLCPYYFFKNLYYFLPYITLFVIVNYALVLIKTIQIWLTIVQFTLLRFNNILHIIISIFFLFRFNNCCWL